MSILIRFLQDPKKLNHISLKEWRTVFLEAKKSNLFGRLAFLIEKENINIPSKIEWHFESYKKQSAQQRQQAIREFKELNIALNSFDGQYALLKGSAYIAHNFDFSFGRRFSDIDILVNKDELGAIELRLRVAGWLRGQIEDYDDKYYREWMHEIPPLHHKDRQTVLDVHHNILPKTNQRHFSANEFNFISIDIEQVGRVKTLAYEDMFIHSAVHLFTESEFNNGLRDIVDLDSLLLELEALDRDIVNRIIERAIKLNVSNYVYYAFRYTYLIMNNRLACYGLEQLSFAAPKHLYVFDLVFINVFKPDVAHLKSFKVSLAKLVLYWRGHLLRMPLRLLIPHLCRKAYMRIAESFDKKSTINDEQLP
ncbi:nucleotidyltransferase family protein [Catenovulum sp. 2E275]|uniref:nucleotidyltransferase family protein n=1 Tax=Catenovulum sp. 2E275 TaxID=2980497 RepID=UPI0021CE8298|nr:nucleotidyltransferase family protein [Catenovulum sp. 2E275]MCU4675571.1 nucleotidyltransferase family protein [Catenovulum sp. 2E275]